MLFYCLVGGRDISYECLSIVPAHCPLLRPFTKLSSLLL